jgi:hypothetical protein
MNKSESSAQSSDGPRFTGFDEKHLELRVTIMAGELVA